MALTTPGATATTTSASWTCGAPALLLAAARTLPLVWLVPALGGWRLSPVLRVALGGMLALLCLPMAASALGVDPGRLVSGLAGGSGGCPNLGSASAPAGPLAGPPIGTARIALLLLRELAVGVSIGVAAGALFRAAELAGLVSGAFALPASGGADGGGVGPSSSSSPVAELYLLLGIVGFLELGGLTMLVEALVRSYALIPLADRARADPLAAAGRVGVVDVRGVAELVLAATARIFETALGLAAPAIVAASLVSLPAIFLARAVPGLGGLIVAPPARAWLGLAVVLLGLGALELTAGGGWRAAMSQLWPLVAAAIELWRR